MDVGSGDEADNYDDEQLISESLNKQSPSVELLFELPLDYPETKPSIQIVNSTCLEEDELAELLNDLSRKADESLGTVMTFMIVSDVVEWLSTKTESVQVDEIDEENIRKQKELDAEAARKIEGTAVTVESFLAWKAKFDAELLKCRLEQKKQSEQAAGSQRRLTGREMFETDNALAESDLNFVDELEQDQIEALMQNIDDIDLYNDDDQDYEPNSDDEEASGDEGGYDSDDKSD